MSQLSPQEPSYVFGYWRPWKAESNMIDSYLDYVKDVSLVKYGSDTVGKYLQEASKEQIGAIKELGNSLGKGLNVLGKGMGVLSNQMASIDSSLSFLNRNVDLMIEQQRMSNLLLHNISQLLRVPDSEKERQHAIERGVQFFVNARIDSDLYSDSLMEFLKAEALVQQDYFVLHRIGLIYLYVPKLLNPLKALDYFLRAAKYARIESNPNAMHLENVLTGNITSNSNINPENALQHIQKLAGDSWEKAAFACYVLGRFDDAVTCQSNALVFVTSPQHQFTLAKYTARIGKSIEASSILDKCIDEDPRIYNAAFYDIDLINDAKIVELLSRKHENILNEIQQLNQEFGSYRFKEAQELQKLIIDHGNLDYPDKVKGLSEIRIQAQKLRKTNNDWLVMNQQLDNVIAYVENLNNDSLKTILIECQKVKAQMSFQSMSRFCKDFTAMCDTCLDSFRNNRNRFEFIRTVFGNSALVDVSRKDINKLLSQDTILSSDTLKRYEQYINELETSLSKHAIKIGDRFDGGVVFEISSDLNSALVYSLNELGTAAWGKNGKLGTTQGLGLENTSLILMHGGSATAASVCKNSKHNGFSDWFLPSLIEAKQIIKFSVQSNSNDLLKRSIVGNKFWTSSEVTDKVELKIPDLVMAPMFGSGQAWADKMQAKGYQVLKHLDPDVPWRGGTFSTDSPVAAKGFISKYVESAHAFLSDGTVCDRAEIHPVIGIRKVIFSNSEVIETKTQLTQVKENTITKDVSSSLNKSRNSDTILIEEVENIIKSFGNLNIMGGRLNVKGQIDEKKWRNFSKQYDSIQIGTIDDCYIYFDNTVFGGGDDGFMMTKNLFCWKNKFSKPLSTFNSERVPGYKAGADTARFYLWKDSFNVCNGASEHHPDSAGPGFTIDSNKSLIDLNRTVDVLNKILQVIRGKYNG